VVAENQLTASMPGRYASALFDLAKAQGQIKDVEADLGKFAAALESNPDLLRMVRSPVFSSTEQSMALEHILAKSGLGPLASNFLKLLARNRRLFAVGDMIKIYRALSADFRGEVTAEVASAHPLSDAQLAALTDTLKSSVGKDVQIHAKVDPSLLGGLIVKIGSRMIDSSLRTKLNSLKVAMKGTG
jgi:F-type H+-transporting ATPase subunit delta